jgi:hypothetical protein
MVTDQCADIRIILKRNPIKFVVLIWPPKRIFEWWAGLIEEPALIYHSLLIILRSVASRLGSHPQTSSHRDTQRSIEMLTILSGNLGGEV